MVRTNPIRNTPKPLIPSATRQASRAVSLNIELKRVRGAANTAIGAKSPGDMRKHVIVIGAGYGGLSAAGLLAKQGYRVTVVEQNAMPGGRAMLYQEQGFAFDMGPSWYLQPEVFDRWFGSMGSTPGQHYKLSRLDPSYRIMFGPKDTVDISADLQKNLAYFESVEEGSAEKFKAYLAEAKYKYDVSLEEFLYKEYRSYKDFLSKRMLSEGRKLHVFESFDKYAKRFFKSKRLRQILEYPVVFLGGNPKKTPALYSLLAHADYNLGVWYPHGGMHAVAKAMHSLGEKAGVKTIFNTRAEKILVENGRAVGVHTSAGTITADAVVVNADYAWAEMNLLAPEYQTYKQRYWEKRVIAPSGFVIYLGVSKRIANLKHHTLVFENDWEKHFDEVFDKPQWPSEPHYYVCTPSKTDSGVAPRGMENLFILVPVAAGLSDDDAIREEYTEKIITHLEKTIGESIRPNIVVKRAFSHRDFTQLYNAYKGTALGLAHTLFQSAIFRPAPRSKKVQGLFYSGQFTTPGVGVPMCIISGTVCADMVNNELKRAG